MAISRHGPEAQARAVRQDRLSTGALRLRALLAVSSPVDRRRRRLVSR